MTNTATPGVSDSIVFTGDPTADSDGDGVTALMEFFLGTSDTDTKAGRGALSPSVLTVQENGVPVTYPAVTFTRRNGTDSLACTVEVSSTLAPWKNLAGAAVLMETSRNGDIVTQTWRSPIPQITQPRQFLRLKVQQ
jgi:hypothetical protein